MLDSDIVQSYIDILHEELVPATGCTEPTAIAYCAATLQKLLGCRAERVEAVLSGNILKNVKSVVVPNTGGRKGIRPAIAAGMIAGDPTKGLQVIAEVPQEKQAEIEEFLKTTEIDILCGESPCRLDIDLRAWGGEHSARARVTNHHTNLVYLERDGEILCEFPVVDAAEEHMTDKACLNVEDILRFADTVPLEKVEEILMRQVELNSAIAEEGLRGAWGAQIGKILMEDYGGDLKQQAKAYAAAGSDARMSGCEMPVVILSGSGNQGITASLPVYVYAKELNVSEEKLYRALLVSNLVTLHEKTGIGRLSAYCGAVSAGAGAGAGITYLYGGGCREISHTIVNALAVTSGIVCDGAKSSCAAKIAMAVEAGILGFEMFRCGQQFYGGDGLVAKGVENSIANFSRLGRVGMRETDREIIKMMTE